LGSDYRTTHLGVVLDQNTNKTIKLKKLELPNIGKIIDKVQVNKKGY
jgi:hypothetical protein